MSAMPKFVHQEEESSATVRTLEEIVVDLHREIERLEETIFQLKRDM